ncbi:MAG TPA: DUF2249 domain-containing protein [Longimicrobiales bacterium]|nr:DUF2249 domain-containing protein [Longimicrobiales bacterium]
MVIRADDRVATILREDESLIDVLASLSPAFERLRNPAMRKVMARLVTVEQAARMAGLDAKLLVDQLNAHRRGAQAPAAAAVPGVRRAAAAGAAAGDASRRAHGQAVEPASSSHGQAAAQSAQSDRSHGQAVEPSSAARPAPGEGAEPPALAAIPAERRIVLDVRDELRAGNEPFRAIMTALRERPDDGALAVRAIFEPVPLYTVMRRQGLEHYTEELGPEDWRVWFYADGSEPAADRPENVPETAPDVAVSAATDDVVVLDVRGLEPPEPMMRTLAALEQLPVGGTLVQLNVRVPQFLLPLLEERGFTYEVREQDAELVRVFIRRRTA